MQIVPEPVAIADEKLIASRFAMISALAHKTVWKEFISKDESSNTDSYLIVFENNAACAVPGCGDLAIEAIR